MRILVFGVNWLGDTLFSTPVFRCLKKHFTNSTVDCITHPRCKELLLYNPFIRKIIEFDERSIHKSFLKRIKFIKEIKDEQYDMVILLHRSFTRAFLCYLAGIKERIGYATTKRKLLLTHKITPPSYSIHRQDYYLKILEEIGVKIEMRKSELFISDKERLYVQKLFEMLKIKDGKLVAVNVGSNWELKRWPYFAELVNLLVEKEITVFITGAHKELSFFNRIKDKIRYKEKVLNLIGKTSLLQLAALYEKMDCVISSDSGPLHIAGAMNTNIIGIYGPTHPKITGPRTASNCFIFFEDVGCKVPCYIKRCPRHLLCLKTIKPYQVFQKVLEFLE